MHRVAGFFADALGEAGAVADLLLDGELDAGQFVLAREVAEDGSFSQTGPERLPATKQVEMWTSAGRFIRLANAMTFCVPTTLVRSALSSGGLKVTLPALLMRTSMSSATASASSSVKPRLSSLMSPSTSRTLSRMKSSKAAP